eukprot:1420449-Rhodomonas_salina.1
MLLPVQSDSDTLCSYQEKTERIVEITGGLNPLGGEEGEKEGGREGGRPMLSAVLVWRRLEALADRYEVCPQLDPRQ